MTPEQGMVDERISASPPSGDGGSGFFANGRKVALLAAIIAAALVAALWVGYLWASDAFRPAPVVEVRAQNVYSETLHVVTDIDYAPFSYVDGNGEYAGLDVELANEVANRLGMNLDLVLTDWTTAKQMLLTGEAQVLMNMETDSVATDVRLVATIPTTEKEYVVYGREEVSSVAELYGRNVASLHAMPELGLEDSITYIDSYADIFEGLKAGDYEFALCPIQVGNSFLEKLGMQDVRPSYAVSHVYGAFALRADEADLRDRLNPVLRDLQEEGFLDRLDAKWVNHHYENADVVSVVAHRPALAALALIAVFLVVMSVIMLAFARKSTLAHEEYTRQLQEQQAELIRARDRAQAADHAKTAFLFNMSHDIRTPMNAIIGYTDLAQREDDPQAVQGYLGKIQASGHHLLALINDVLEMSRIESGKLELQPAPCDLGAVADELRDLFETQMSEKGIAYDVDASGLADRWVLCDAGHLDRVLLNLVSNALKFTPAGGSVSVSFAQEGPAAADRAPYLIRVADTGIGMSPEFTERVFDLFERERTSTVSGIQGTGLGMAIAKSIVEAMGGAISVESVPGEGTTFTVSVELQVADPPATGTGGEGPVGADAGGEVDFAGKRLLLVEDNEINREIALAILEGLGFEVETAENGQVAVDKVQEARFDAVLMDIQMPVLDGYGATRAIRALDDPAAARVPIAALTANAFDEDAAAAREAGMDGHIAKPIDVAQLAATLQRMLAGQGQGSR